MRSWQRQTRHDCPGVGCSVLTARLHSSLEGTLGMEYCILKTTGNDPSCLTSHKQHLLTWRLKEETCMYSILLKTYLLCVYKMAIKQLPSLCFTEIWFCFFPLALFMPYSPEKMLLPEPSLHLVKQLFTPLLSPFKRQLFESRHSALPIFSSSVLAGCLVCSRCSVTDVQRDLSL